MRVHGAGLGRFHVLRIPVYGEKVDRGRIWPECGMFFTPGVVVSGRRTYPKVVETEATRITGKTGLLSTAHKFAVAGVEEVV